MVIGFLERVFFEKSNFSYKETSSCYTNQNSILPSTDDLQNNITRGLIKVLMMPFTIPYKIFWYFLMIPIRSVDQVVELALQKVKMTKGDA
jgi:hypothetical protein